MPNNKLKTSLISLILLSIAMAFLESAVVVYLREIYYPQGFFFPLSSMDRHIAITEFLREIATMVMLVTMAMLAAQKAIERFAAFIMAFAIWDIFYYIFLKLLLNWPLSIMEWDVLFLLPFTWTGPVLTPVINSVLMIVLAAIIFYFGKRQVAVKVGKFNWSLLIFGSLLVLIAYMQEYTTFMRSDFSWGQMLFYQNIDAQFAKALQFIPQHFPWGWYCTGVGMHIWAIVNVFIKHKKTT